MFFTYCYVIGVALVAIATKFLAAKKGWGAEKLVPSLLLRNPDWFFIAFWFGPLTFILVSALPCRWDIPESELGNEATQRRLNEEFDRKIRESQSATDRWISARQRQLKDLTILSAFMVVFFSAPLFQLAIILHFGFGLLQPVLDFMNQVFLLILK